MTAPPTPRLVVEVCHGRDRGLKGHLRVGGRLTVGRTERSAMIIPHDRQLSGRHFSVTWNGERGRVKPDGGETLVDGRPVDEAEVGHGTWIRAGQTDFQVFVEAQPTPRTSELAPRDPTPPPPWWADRDPMAERALGVLQREREAPLFAVVDASRHPDIIPMVRTSIDRYRSLYDGARAETLTHVAPHLVAFEPGSNLLERLVRTGWGRRWGIFIASSLSFEQTRRHLRRFLMVKLATERHPVYFRFYDPWVLASVKQRFPARQWFTLAGPFEEIVYESPDTGAPVIATAEKGRWS